MRAPAKKEDIVEKNATRLAYLDNIRNLLTILVVMRTVQGGAGITLNTQIIP